MLLDQVSEITGDLTSSLQSNIFPHGCKTRYCGGKAAMLAVSHTS